MQHDDIADLFGAEDDDLGGGRLHEALAPVVTARRVSSPPFDAIVQGGRRRTRNRRIGLAAAGAAVVAAVPLALPAFAGGDRSPGVSAASRPITQPDTVASITASATAVQPSRPSDEELARQRAAALPKTPTLLTSGAFGGHTWKITVVGGKGNNELTKDLHCLHETLTLDGKAQTQFGDAVISCVEDGRHDGYSAFGVPVGHGSEVTVFTGTAAADVATVTARIAGVAEPVTVDTVKVPGIDATYFGIGAAVSDYAHVQLAMFDAAGHQVGSFDNSANGPTAGR